MGPGYRERDEAQRQVFITHLSKYSATEGVYVDEAGVDDTEDYAYGWCAQQERFHALKLGHRSCRISKELSGRIILPEKFRMIAGWCNRQVLAPMTFEGYCNTAVVEVWVEQVLVPALKPGQTVVIDNASFHKSLTLRELIEQRGGRENPLSAHSLAGCTVLFLPPYSPCCCFRTDNLPEKTADLNKIEKFWARLKHYLRKTMQQFECFWDAVDNAFRALSLLSL